MSELGSAIQGYQKHQRNEDESSTNLDGEERSFYCCLVRALTSGFCIAAVRVRSDMRWRAESVCESGMDKSFYLE